MWAILQVDALLQGPTSPALVRPGHVTHTHQYTTTVCFMYLSSFLVSNSRGMSRIT